MKHSVIDGWLSFFLPLLLQLWRRTYGDGPEITPKGGQETCHHKLGFSGRYGFPVFRSFKTCGRSPALGRG